MQIKYILIFIGLITLSSGCFTYKSYVPIDLKEIDLELPISISEISINDNRADISTEDDIKIPVISGFKRKAWKHHPKLTLEHKEIIENTIYTNFDSNSRDTGSIVVAINYACKEFEQTGKTEIERVYLNIETRLSTHSYIYESNIIDTFQYESLDASNKHFEKFYQTSLRNNLVRNIATLRKQYYSTEFKESECFDSLFTKSQVIENLSLKMTGQNTIEQISVSGKFDNSISQEWSFKVSTNEEGNLTYIECLDSYENKNLELKALMKYLYNLRINKMQSTNCWKLVVNEHEH